MTDQDNDFSVTALLQNDKKKKFVIQDLIRNPGKMKYKQD